MHELLVHPQLLAWKITVQWGKCSPQPPQPRGESEVDHSFPLCGIFAYTPLR